MWIFQEEIKGINGNNETHTIEQATNFVVKDNEFKSVTFYHCFLFPGRMIDFSWLTNSIKYNNIEYFHTFELDSHIKSEKSIINFHHHIQNVESKINPSFVYSIMKVLCLIISLLELNKFFKKWDLKMFLLI